MKHTLKNRPKLAKGECSFRVSDYCRAYIDEWFEGFEKELREELERIQSDGTSDMLLENFIEEILGDSEYCDRCGGLGKLGVLSNIQTDPKATMICPDCKGTGERRF